MISVGDRPSARPRRIPITTPETPNVTRYDRAAPGSSALDPTTALPHPTLFPPGGEPGRRFVSLDVLRAGAILLVLFGHVTFRVPENTAGQHAFFVLRQLGLVGVDMFYVLSGFLVGGLLLAEHAQTGRVALGRFFARRAWRIWPGYFLAVLFGWQWYHHFHKDVDGNAVAGVPLRDMWPFFAHVQNYYNIADHKFGAGAVMQTWTVASLVHFYVFVALLVALLAAIGKSAVRAIPWLVAVTFAACFLLRWHAAPVDAKAYDAWRHYFPTHLRLDEPMLGVLLAYLVVHRRDALDRFMRAGGAWLALVAAAAAMLPVAMRKEEGPRFLCIWGYTLAGVGCGALILACWWLEQRRHALAPDARPGPIGYLGRALAMVGVWSYSIYLWHQPLCTNLLGDKARRFVGNHLVHWDSRFHYPAAALAYMLVAIGIGAFMYYALERPLLALRERFTGASDRPARPAANGAFATATFTTPRHAPTPTPAAR